MTKEIICAVIKGPCDQEKVGKCNICPHADNKINSLLDMFVRGHENVGRRDIRSTRGSALVGLQTINVGHNPEQIKITVKNGVVSADIH